MLKRKSISDPQELIAELKNLKQQNKHRAELALSKEEKKFLEEQGYIIEPLLYEIKTKRFKNLKNRCSFCKEMHQMCKRNKMLEVRRLKKKEIEFLESEGIKYRIVRYVIYL